MCRKIINPEYEERRVNFYKKYENEYYEFQTEILKMNAAELRDYIEKINYIEEIYCWIENTDLSYEELLDLTKGKSLDNLSDMMIKELNLWKTYENFLRKQNDNIKVN